MGSANVGYLQPGVSFSSLTSQAVAPGPGPNGILCIVGTAVQGSNQPKLFTTLADAINEYGSASANAAPGFNLEQAMEIAFSQTGASAQLQVYGIRAGATVGSIAVPQKVGGLNAYLFSANPEYAGNNTVTVVVGASTYNSGIGYYTQTVAVYNGPIATATIVEQYPTTPGVAVLNSPNVVASAINAQSQIVTVASAGGTTQSNDNAMGQAGTYVIGGGLTGQNSVDQDYINAINLAQNINCDFICAMSGTSGVQAGLFNHVTAMAGINKFREAFLGFNYTGASEGTVVNNAVAAQGAVSSRYTCMLANSGGYRINPVTQLPQIYDGFYWTAALGALKAMNNAANPLTRQSIAGLIQLTETILNTDLITLGQYGIISLVSLNGSNLVYDGLTLANWPSNYRKENVASAENKLSAIILSQVNPLIGQADPNSDINLIKQTVTTALNYAVHSNVIVGWDQTQLSVTGVFTTTGVFTVTIVYLPRIEIGQIKIQLQLSLNVLT